MESKRGGRVEEGCGGGWVGTLDALKASSRGESLGDFMADCGGRSGRVIAHNEEPPRHLNG